MRYVHVTQAHTRNPVESKWWGACACVTILRSYLYCYRQNLMPTVAAAACLVLLPRQHDALVVPSAQLLRGEAQLAHEDLLGVLAQQGRLEAREHGARLILA